MPGPRVYRVSAAILAARDRFRSKTTAATQVLETCVAAVDALVASRTLTTSFWLGNRDSNPNYLIQSQAFYR